MITIVWLWSIVVSTVRIGVRREERQAVGGVLFKLYLQAVIERLGKTPILGDMEQIGKLRGERPQEFTPGVNRRVDVLVDQMFPPNSPT